MKFDFIKIANCLFFDRDTYNQIQDEDKIYNFFIINRKLSKLYPKNSQFLNNKFIDKSSALDLWLKFLLKKNINSTPYWWYDKDTKILKDNKSKISKLSKVDRDLLIKYYEFNDKDLQFMIDHYYNDIQDELKKLKKFS